MSLVRNNPEDGYFIRSYQPGECWVDTTLLTENFILLRHNLITPWTPSDINALSADDLSVLLALKPDILLIGTGEQLVFPPPDVYSDLIHHKIGVEIMNTSAACRTFNALASEHRHVAAALFLK